MFLPTAKQCQEGKAMSSTGQLLDHILTWGIFRAPGTQRCLRLIHEVYVVSRPKLYYLRLWGRPGWEKNGSWNPSGFVQHSPIYYKLFIHLACHWLFYLVYVSLASVAWGLGHVLCFMWLYNPASPPTLSPPQSSLSLCWPTMFILICEKGQWPPKHFKACLHFGIFL